MLNIIVVSLLRTLTCHAATVSQAPLWIPDPTKNNLLMFFFIPFCFGLLKAIYDILCYIYQK